MSLFYRTFRLWCTIESWQPSLPKCWSRCWGKVQTQSRLETTRMSHHMTWRQQLNMTSQLILLTAAVLTLFRKNKKEGKLHDPGSQCFQVLVSTYLFVFRFRFLVFAFCTVRGYMLSNDRAKCTITTMQQPTMDLFSACKNVGLIPRLEDSIYACINLLLENHMFSAPPQPIRQKLLFRNSWQLPNSSKSETTFLELSTYSRWPEITWRHII